MNQPLDDSALRRAVSQYLEDLARSGVEQLPRAGQVAASRPPSGAPRSSDVSHQTRVPRALPSRDFAGPPADPPEVRTIGERIVRIDPPGGSLLSASEPVVSAAADRSQQGNIKMTELQVLSEQIGNCTRCPELVLSRSRTVFGVGDPNARLCFFGEAPGADEDRIGEPFVGRAGQLLDRIIQACTLQRSDVYILNTIKCRPQGNRTPELEEVENCRPFFERQLEIIRPEFICCLGLVAARALLGTKLPLGRLRGQFHRWRFAQVIVTYHPAYLLRNPDAKRHTWEDMQMLMRAMGVKGVG